MVSFNLSSAARAHVVLDVSNSHCFFLRFLLLLVAVDHDPHEELDEHGGVEGVEGDVDPERTGVREPDEFESPVDKQDDVAPTPELARELAAEPEPIPERDD